MSSLSVSDSRPTESQPADPVPTESGPEAALPGAATAAAPDAPTFSRPQGSQGREGSAITVQDVYVTYRINTQKVPTLKSALARRGHDKRAIREVKALRGVSFDVPHGKVMGVIGANGAGKSTLMRAVAGILPPSAGRIEVIGRVSTLLALGVGFNAQLSGRENVTLGGLAAGLSRAEIKDRYDEIADFAELGEFMDLPMRTYSSGMFSRLGFAVAVHMNPDILIIDEALSTGDAHFKVKAQKKMDELVSQSSTMLLVSHGMATIKDMSDEVVWLHKGEKIRQGKPDEIVDAYMNFLKVGDSAITDEDV